jgi:uncharacterized delta-60 repeat protein
VIGGCLLGAPVDAREGDLDPAFGDVGRLGPIMDLEGPVWSLETLNDDGILLAGGEFELDCPDIYCDSPPIRFRGTNFLKQVSGAGVIESSLDAALPENFQVRDVARQPDGKLVVVGRTAETDSPSLIYLKSRLTILRLLATGQLDTTFGRNGLVELPIEVNDSNSEQGGMSVLLEPHGRIVVSGSLNQQLIVLRLLENGSFDDSFGEFGVYRESQRNIDSGLQILHTSSGNYRVLGNRCEVVGLTGAGALDDAFGTSGVAMATARGGPGSCGSISGLSDDRLVVAGSAEGHGFVTRLLADGQLDPNFSASSIADSATSATALTVGEDESIYVAVTEVDGASIMRLQASGELDRQFGNAGRTMIDLPSDFGVTSRVHTVVVRPDGSVLAAGVAHRGWPQPRTPFAIRLLGRGAGGSPGVLGFSEQDIVDTSEGETEVVVHVRRTGGDSGIAGVTLQTIPYVNPDYAAVPGQDFGEVSRHLTWNDGDSTLRKIRIPIRTDGVAEGHEYFQVRLSDTTGGAGLGTRHVAVHIDSDGAPAGRFYFSATESNVIEGDSVQLTVFRDDYVNGEVSVTLTPIAGTATATEDFDPDPITLFWGGGNAGAKTVAIAVVDDSVQEGPESFIVELSNPTGGAVIGEPSRMTITIEASDQGPPPPPPADAGRLGFLGAGTLHSVAEGSGAIHVPIFRSNGLMGKVSVHYETIAETATPGLDFTAKSDTVTWGDGETGIKFIDVDLSDDDLAESDETFSIRLSNPTGGATISGDAVQVKITDDDEPGVALVSTESTVGEADGSVVVTVARSRSAVGAISVDYATSHDTATEGSDFVATAGTLHWSDGDSASKTIRVDVIDDGVEETDERFELALSNPSGATLGSNSITIVTIADDDSPSDDDPPNDEGGGGGGSDGLLLLGWLLTALARSCMVAGARPPPVR